MANDSVKTAKALNDTNRKRQKVDATHITGAGFSLMVFGLFAMVFGMFSAMAFRNSLITPNFDFEAFGLAGVIFIACGLVSVLLAVFRQDKELDDLIIHAYSQQTDRK